MTLSHTVHLKATLPLAFKGLDRGEVTLPHPHKLKRVHYWKGKL